MRKSYNLIKYIPDGERVVRWPEQWVLGRARCRVTSWIIAERKMTHYDPRKHLWYSYLPLQLLS